MSHDPRCKFQTFFICPNSTFNIRKSQKNFLLESSLDPFQKVSAKILTGRVENTPPPPLSAFRVKLSPLNLSQLAMWFLLNYDKWSFFCTMLKSSTVQLQARPRPDFSVKNTPPPPPSVPLELSCHL